ncbi:thiamine pyrophosphate-binding protein [Bordetella sp. BOR01]|uniref:thiamine pyrophosphate-binding protein n=1 Tax=Bordetella sp. BOR01 TaxID=2854779 RepID=UPI001C46F965|nr:thiamine pyrophosphate-binding protein [Bordetella sp. BOR01]MBV7484542.1 thiamine pyrophosphate-binding protein [Bordetella sp. BOR01]
MAVSARGADTLARSIKAAGITRLFTLSGNHIMPVFDAALSAGIELVHVRHEAGAVHMADAWARLTGEPGVALVTGGPGHANAVSALYTAQMSESPVVLLSGHAPNRQAGWGAFQEMDQAAMAAPVTKASWAAGSAAGLAADFARACRVARSGRPGPVHLSLPTDTLEQSADGPLPVARDYAPVPMPLDAGQAATLVARLGRAQRPLVLVGPQGLTDAGRARVAALQQAWGVPVVATESPRGANDPALGAFAPMLARADCVLLLGKRLDFTLQFGQAFDAACVFMQIDADEREWARTRRALGERLQETLLADTHAALDSLASLSLRGLPEWLAQVETALAYRPPAWNEARGNGSGNGNGLHPAELCRAVQQVLDTHPDSVLVCDGGEFGQWAQACLRAPHRVINGAAGAIGSALPMALAGRLAHRGAPVVAMMGDGTFGFHCAEIDTAVRYGLPFICVVGNDARWNAEYQIQLNSYGAERLVGCELLPTRYDRVAEGFGARGAWVNQADELARALQDAVHADVPTCVNVALAGLPAPVVRQA